MSTARATLKLKYAAPGDQNTEPQFVCNLDYAASNAGFIDIPDETPDATAFTVPYGAVNQPKAIFVKNDSLGVLGVRWGDAEADEYSIAPGGFQLIACPTVPNDPAFPSLKLVTTGLQGAASQIPFIVLGD
jgi:hypothetical protein